MKLVHCLALAASAMLLIPLPACGAAPERGAKSAVKAAGAVTANRAVTADRAGRQPAARSPVAPPVASSPVAPPAAANQQAAAALAASIRSAVAASGLDPAKVAVGVSVRDVGSGALVADIGGSTQMVPASNMKVLTTAAALRVLGADYAFATRLIRAGDRLTVVGDGDPSLGDPDMKDVNTVIDEAGQRRTGLETDAMIDLWLSAAQRAGITQVKELVVDDRIFDREFQHSGWPRDQLSNSYCAEIAGLNFNVGLLQATLTVAGGRVALKEWMPSAPWLELDCRKASPGKGKQPASLARMDNPVRFAVRGNVKEGETLGVCVHDMPEFFVHYLAERMRKAGIKVASVRVADANDPAPAGNPIGGPITSSLAAVVRQCNTESQNLYAESLLKRIGAKRSGKSGSWGNGAAALSEEVDAALGAGTAKTGLTVADGSGLSRDNEVAPNLLSAWLRAIALDPKVGPAFIGSLAVAGKSGTVKQRFKDLDPNRAFVPCKTGYINGVSCLSGFVGAPGQMPRFTFSILCNNLDKDKNGVRDAKALQEKIVSILAGGL